MRRLLPLLLAALAACQVDVEGAPCEIADHCPSGQGCGLDHRCSKRAASASCAHCTPGEKRCGEKKIEECSAATDPVCGEWVPTKQCQDGLVCVTSSDGPACECPPPAGQFAVASPGSVAFSGPAPTGAFEPPQCRFPTLTEALAVAAEAGGGTVIATGGTAGMPPAVFGAATGETLPIDIKSSVTLTTDSSTSGAKYVIQLDDPAATSAVKMHAGAALAAFIVQNVAGDSARDVVAIALACNGANVPVRVDGVTMRGEGAEHRLNRGIHVNDTCGVLGTDVVITGMQSEALLVEASNGTVESTFLRGAFEGNGRGVYLKQGVLKLDGVRVEGNVGRGIEAGSSSGETVLELNAVKVLSNGDTGIAVANNKRLFIVGSTVFGNAAQTSWGSPLFPTPSGYARLSGGIVLRGEPPAASDTPTLRFERNRVYSNKGDQMLVLTTGSEAWHLGASVCAPSSADVSVFGCYDTTTSPPVTGAYRGLVAIDAIAEARYIAWRRGELAPTAPSDYGWYGSTARVDVGDPALYCALPQALDCASPDPQ